MYPNAGNLLCIRHFSADVIPWFTRQQNKLDAAVQIKQLQKILHVA